MAVLCGSFNLLVDISSIDTPLWEFYDILWRPVALQCDPLSIYSYTVQALLSITPTILRQYRLSHIHSSIPILEKKITGKSEPVFMLITHQNFECDLVYYINN